MTRRKLEDICPENICIEFLFSNEICSVCTAERLVKKGAKFVVKSSGHFRALFPEERASAGH